MKELLAYNAGLWSKCPASLRIPGFYPSKLDDRRIEGNVLHRIVGLLYRGTLPPETTPERMQAAMASKLHTGFSITSEHMRLANQAAECCHAIPGGTGTLERAIELKLADRTSTVRPDFIKIHVTDRRLHIVDFKFGFRYVPARDNAQLLCYAAAALRLPEMAQVNITSVELHIVQPRSYTEPTRSWVLSTPDTATHFGKLELAARAAINNEYAVTGPHCWNCYSKARCSAFMDLAASFEDVAFTQIDPQEVPASELGAGYGLFLDMKKTLDLAVDAIESRIMHEINCGKPVVGYMLEPGAGKSKMVDDIATLEAIEGLTGETLIRKSPITVTDAASRPALKPYLSSLIKKTSGKMKLVKFDSEKTKTTFEE